MYVFHKICICNYVLIAKLCLPVCLGLCWFFLFIFPCLSGRSLEVTTEEQQGPYLFMILPGESSKSISALFHYLIPSIKPSLRLFLSRETYNALTTWLSDARMLASQNIVIILCGNKKDLETDREVTFLEASRFAQENGSDWTPLYLYGSKLSPRFYACTCSHSYRNSVCIC